MNVGHHPLTLKSKRTLPQFNRCDHSHVGKISADLKHVRHRLRESGAGTVFGKPSGTTRLGREGALKVLAEANAPDREVSSTDKAARTPIPFENC